MASRTVVLAVNPNVLPDVRTILAAGSMCLGPETGGDGLRVRVHEFVSPHQLSPVRPTRTPAEVAARMGMPRRMVQTLEMLAEGLAVKEIARRMGVAPASAKTHTARLYRFLDVNGAPAAVAEGFRMGLLTGGEG